MLLMGICVQARIQDFPVGVSAEDARMECQNAEFVIMTWMHS